MCLTLGVTLAPVSMRMLWRDDLRSCRRGSSSASGGGGGAAMWLPNTLVRNVLDGRRSAVGGGDEREVMASTSMAPAQQVLNTRKDKRKERNESKVVGRCSQQEYVWLCSCVL